jgi:hypothetical protein
MSFETDLYAVLAAVTPRVFPDFAPVTTQRPYVTYQQIGGEVFNPLSNDDPGIRHSAMQISVWADTRVQAMTLSRSIEAAMRAATAFTARPDSAATGDFDADIPVYGASQDFSCWHAS